MWQPKRVSHQPASLQWLGSRIAKSRMIPACDNQAESNVITRLQLAQAPRRQLLQERAKPI
jgi:hypothetical protein